jgi:hypothetical protein
MFRHYVTGRMWPFRATSDLMGAARRAEALAKSLGWPPKDADALSRVVLELGGDAMNRAGGGTCRLEASTTSADVIVEDLGGVSALARVEFAMPQVAFAAAG